MSVEEVEIIVSQFTRDEFLEFRKWFLEYDWEVWDKEFEKDVAAGRLDALAEEALLEFKEGRTTEL